MLLAFSAVIGAADDVIATDPNWEITASSNLSDNQNIQKAFDGNVNTIWHTKYVASDGKITSRDEPPFTIDVKFGKEMTVAGWRYTPRNGNPAGVVQEYNIYASADGKKYEKIFSGSFDFDVSSDTTRQPDSAFWGEKKMKMIRIEITKSVGNYGSAAEINFYAKGTAGSGDNTSTSKPSTGAGSGASTVPSDAVKIFTDPNWDVKASSEMAGAQSIKSAFDGEVNTIWHTKFTVEGSQITSHDEPPFTIDVKFGKEMTVAGWCYTPRNGNGAGIIQEYNIYSSSDGKKFEKIYSGTFDIDYKVDATRSSVSAFWGEKKMKALRIEITKSVGNYGSAAEIEFYSKGTSSAASGTTGTKPAEDKKDDKKDETGTSSASDGTPFLSRTGWKAEVNSVLNAGFAVEKIFDGNVATYWHSKYTIEDGKVAGHDEPPYNLVVTLPSVVETSGIVLTPRTDSINGRFFGGNIYVSDTDDGEWFLLKEQANFRRDGKPHEMFFNMNLKIKRVWVEVTSTHGGFGTLAEFNLMQKNDKLKAGTYEEFKVADAANTIYEIDREGMTAESSAPNWQTTEKLFDGGHSSFWQTEAVKESDWPIVLTVDLKNVYKLKEIHVQPRNTADHHGAWLKLTVNGSVDGSDWVELKSGLTYEDDLADRIIRFDEEKAVRYVEFCIENAVASRASAAEITFWETKTAKEEREAANKVTYTLKIGSNKITTEKAGTKTEKEIDVAPFIVNGSTMIPLRGLLEEMGAEIGWNGQNKTVTVNNGINVITLQIWNYNVSVTNTKYGDVVYSLLNPPIISDSRTFIPIRFVSEQLGYNVSWDGETQTVTITK